jgi:hypothetical protein
MRTFVIVVALILIACWIFVPVRKWRIDRTIRRTIDFDRICRLADISKKNFTYSPLSYHSYSDAYHESRRRGYRFMVEFTYHCAPCHAQAKQGNGFYLLDQPFEVDTLYSGEILEREIADAILRIKCGTADGERWMYQSKHAQAIERTAA